MVERKSWDQYFIEQAGQVASRSKDPARQVGAIIVRPDNTEASRGYNGFPKGIEDTIERYLDKEFKSMVVMHAEENAIRNAREDLTGCTLYVSPYMPCAHCASWIISKGIKRVVTDMGSTPEKWSKNFEVTKEIFAEAGVVLDSIWPEVRDIPYRKEPHFIAVDEDGNAPILCEHINFNNRGERFLWKRHYSMIDYARAEHDLEGLFDHSGRVLVYRGNRIAPEDLGFRKIVWRGDMSGVPLVSLYDEVEGRAKHYRDNHGR